MKTRTIPLIVPMLAGCGMETEGADQHVAGTKSHTSAAAALTSRSVDLAATVSAVTDDQSAAAAA